MYLLCTTTDSTGLCNHGVVQVTRDYARKLLEVYRPLWEHVHKIDNSLYCLEFFNPLPVWGDCTLAMLDEELLATEDWLEVDSAGVVKSRLPVAAQCLQITENSVLWSASPSEGDGYFETRELSWDQLRQIAAGDRPFAAAGGRKETPT